MRFSVFLTLVVATFIACTSFTSADNARHLKGSDLTADGEERAANFGQLDEATKKLKADQIVAQAVKNFNIGKINRAADAMKAGAGKAAELTTKQQGQITKMVAAAAKKKVPWSKTKKIIVGLVGFNIGGVALYALYKMYMSNGGTATTTTAA
ncbi:uncharacterized protein KRP23_12186 [Phytophthora ramorum]|uniref:uncharacterized protein n=1 Tax=Phytophthora ramorum TaxID=164328 RepID=UPI0030B4A730|nr:hypothetical protein KRP23_12186 [Phytophthora ramorum]